MDADGSSSGWLLLLAQLPSTPSSARVALWRRLRAIGATAVVNGTWVLPDTAPHAEFFEQLRDNILGQGGTAFVLVVPVSSPDVHEAIAGRFRADRGREYDEFAERCTALLDEIGREARAGKYTFAEMEESEQDLEKLTRWLAKIKARDFLPDERAQRPAELLVRCQRALEGFSQAVYAAEGVQEPVDGVTVGSSALTESAGSSEPDGEVSPQKPGGDPSGPRGLHRQRAACAGRCAEWAAGGLFVRLTPTGPGRPI
jgi:hypothetical protein